MTNQSSSHIEEILSYFKNSYRKLVSTNIQISYEEVLKHYSFSIGLTSLIDHPALQSWYDRIHNHGFLRNMIDEFQHHEICLHGHQTAVIYNSSGKMTIELSSLSAEDFQLSLEILALKNSQDWNYNSPFVSFHCSNFGSAYRISLLHFSSGVSTQSKLFARKIFNSKPTLSLFELDHHLEEALKTMILQKKNILISGCTGSGKTTFMRSLLLEIDNSEHLIVLEDTHEIIPFHTTTTYLHASKLACANALRMSPDRMILGEMRSHEVIPFLLAMNTGHKGLMSTIHANSASDAISRVALLFSMYSENKDITYSTITKLICRSVDVVIHLENKKIVEIVRILGSDGENPIYESLYDL